MSVDEQSLNEHLVLEAKESSIRQIRACFSTERTIPVLANGKSVSNSFGLISGNDNNTWQGDGELEITIAYEDLDGRPFHHCLTLFIKEDQGFASGFWKRSESDR